MKKFHSVAVVVRRSGMKKQRFISVRLSWWNVIAKRHCHRKRRHAQEDWNPARKDIEFDVRGQGLS